MLFRLMFPHNLNQVQFRSPSNQSSSAAFSSAIRAGKPFVTPIKCLINIISARETSTSQVKKEKPQKNKNKNGKTRKAEQFSNTNKLANRREGCRRICCCLMWQHARTHARTQSKGQLIKGVNWLNDAWSRSRRTWHGPTRPVNNSLAAFNNKFRRSIPTKRLTDRSR